MNIIYWCMSFSLATIATDRLRDHLHTHTHAYTNHGAYCPIYVCSCSSAVEYILRDERQRERLSISSIPRPFPRRVIRAPVPWSDTYKTNHSWCQQNLYTVNSIMYQLKKLWMNK